MRQSPTAQRLEHSDTAADAVVGDRVGFKFRVYRTPLRLADAERIAAGRRSRVIEPDETDVIDLPEPIEDERPRAAATRRRPPAEPMPEFDYARWSRDLDDLLSRPHTEFAGADGMRSRASSSGSTAAEGDADDGRPSANPATGSAPSSVSADIPTTRGRSGSTWMPLLVLLTSSAVMAAVIGLAAYGLSSREMQTWLRAAEQWFNR